MKCDAGIHLMQRNVWQKVIDACLQHPSVRQHQVAAKSWESVCNTWWEDFRSMCLFAWNPAWVSRADLGRLSFGCRSYWLSLRFQRAGPWVYHLLLRHVSMGTPPMVASELADVRLIMSQLQTDLAEEGGNQVSVMVYNVGSRSPNFTRMQSVMTIITLIPIPRKVRFPL